MSSPTTWPGITQWNNAGFGLAAGPVTAWPDQTGNNRTPNNTGAARPTALVDALGFAAIDCPYAGATEFMPAATSGATKGNFTVVAIMRRHGFNASVAGRFVLNTANTALIELKSNLVRTWSAIGGYVDTLTRQLANTHLVAFDSAGFFRLNGFKLDTAQTYGTTAALPGIAVYGAGNNTVALRWPGMIHDLMVFDHALSDAEWATVQAYAATYRIPSAPFTRQLIVHGDSLAFGHTATNTISPIQAVEALVSPAWLRQNIAIPGATLAFLEAGSHVTNDANFIAIVSTLPSTMVFSIGANDLLSVTPANVLAGVIRCATYYKANGLDRFIAETVTPRTGLTDATRLTYNALLRANTDPAIDAVSDPGGHAILGDVANIGNTTYFHADQIHMADAGNIIRAACIASAVRIGSGSDQDSVFALDVGFGFGF